MPVAKRNGIVMAVQKVFWTSLDCKFGNFRENFIFANSVKRHNCDVKIREQGMIYL